MTYAIIFALERLLVVLIIYTASFGAVMVMGNDDKDHFGQACLGASVLMSIVFIILAWAWA